MPVAVSGFFSLVLVAVVVVAVAVVAAAAGMTFSFSGSWNETDFLTETILEAGRETADLRPGVGLVLAVVQIVPAFFVMAVARVRADFLTGSVSDLSSSGCAALRVVRVRVALTGSDFAGPAMDFFTLPRVARVVVVLADVSSLTGSGSCWGAGSTIFLGLPRALGGLFMVSADVGASSSAVLWDSSSFSVSSALVFRLVEGAVRTVVVEVVVLVAVALLVGATALVDLAVGALLLLLLLLLPTFAAARARVIRFGGL